MTAKGKWFLKINRISKRLKHFLKTDNVSWKNGFLLRKKFQSLSLEIQMVKQQYFQLAENIHRDNILHQTIAPARISKQAEDKAIQSAIQLANAFELVGTLAVEMFLTEEDTIYINELAPRPHNSGHYTIEACETSQFEQHIRAVCNLPLGKYRAIKTCGYGQYIRRACSKCVRKYNKAYRIGKFIFMVKKRRKLKRKMGHVTHPM